MKSSADIGKITVVGGDGRQKATYDYLCSLGFSCALFGFSPSSHRSLSQALAQSECVILPLPLSKDSVTVFSDIRYLNLELEELAGMLSAGQKIFAGLPGTQAREIFASHSLKLQDYFGDESLMLYNAQLTAQGILRVILENTDRLFNSQSVLITGFGRVGRCTASLLDAVGADVTVCVRTPVSEAQVKLAGHKSLYYDWLDEKTQLFDVIVNTVPVQVIDREAVKAISEACLLLESASAPYGIDLDAARQYGKRLIMCPGLPGKYTPVSAGRAIAEAVLRMVGEDV